MWTDIRHGRHVLSESGICKEDKGLEEGVDLLLCVLSGICKEDKDWREDWRFGGGRGFVVVCFIRDMQGGQEDWRRGVDRALG